MNNYYDILGVDTTAKEESIKSAFKSLAKQYHPDKNPGDKVSEEKFKKINEAYQVLSDTSKRFFYDMKLENQATGRRAEAPPPTPAPKRKRSVTTPPTATETKIWVGTALGLAVIALAAMFLYNFMNRYTARELFGEGLVFQRNKVWAGALGKYSEAIGYDKQFAMAYYQRGMLRSAVLGDYDGAIHDLNLAIKVSDTISFLFFNGRAKLYTELKQHTRALADYTQCLVIKPNSDSTWYKIADITFREHKNYVKAIENYDKALQLNPKFGNAYFGRGLCYQQLSQHQRAIRDFTLAIQNNGSQPAWFHHRGLSELALHHQTRACRDFGIALEMGYNKSLRPLQNNCF